MGEQIVIQEELQQLTAEVTPNPLVTVQEKLDRIKKELAVAACAIEDGVVDLEKAKSGMLNLIAYIEVKSSLPEEYNPSTGSLEIVQRHLDKIKEFEKNRARKKG